MMWRYAGAWGGNYGFGGIGMGIGMIVNLLVVAAIIFLVVRLFRGGLGCQVNHMGHSHGPVAGGRQDAVDIVTRRYASGEITREEYHQMMEDLKKYGESQ